jgi:hypothetical protein
MGKAPFVAQRLNYSAIDPADSIRRDIVFHSPANRSGVYLRRARFREAHLFADQSTQGTERRRASAMVGSSCGVREATEHP